MPDQTTRHAPAEALRAAADTYDDAAVRRLDLGQTTALIADAVWQMALAEGRRQAAQHLLSLTVDHLVIAIEVALADGAPSNNGELLHRVVAVLADALDRVDAEPPTRQTTEGWEREWAVDLGSRGGRWPLHPCDSEADARRVAAAYAKARTVVNRLVGPWEPTCTCPTPDAGVIDVNRGHLLGCPRLRWLAAAEQNPCPTCSGPIRETVGMVCRTCGTDYAPAEQDGNGR